MPLQLPSEFQQAANYGLPGTSMGLESMPGLGGAMQATDYGNLQDTLQRNFRDSDLANQQAQLEYQRSQAQQPVIDAQRQLELSKLGIQQSGYDNGTQAQIAKTGSAATIAENLAKKSDADLNTMQTHLNGAYNMDQIMQHAAGGSDDIEKKIGATLMQPSAVSALRESAKRAGIDFPADIDHE